MEQHDPLFDKFLNGQCTAEEWEAVHALIAQNPAIVEQYVARMDMSQLEEITGLSEEVSLRMFSAVRKKTWLRDRKRRKMQWVAGMAAGIIFALAGIQVLTQLSGSKNDNPAAAYRPSGSLVFTNHTNQKKEMLLPDSSRVVMYSGAMIELKPGFNDPIRELSMTGEADFYVAHNPEKPFVVMTGKYATTAVGTSFKVVYERENPRLLVQLMTGRVKIEQCAEEGRRTVLCFLRPGEQMTLNTRDGKLILDIPADTTRLRKQIKTRQSSKKEHASAIEVDRKTLPDLLDQLQREFDTTIVYNREELQSLNVTATFGEGELLSDILRQLASLNGLSFAWNGRAYVIMKKK